MKKVLRPQAADPKGDEGELTSGATRTGTICSCGEMDRYWLSVRGSEVCSLVVTDAGNSSFYPRIALYRPDGILVGTDGDGNVAVVSGAAPVSEIGRASCRERE